MPPNPSQRVSNPIPYGDLDTLFLDVGNTLISMDLAWIRDELAHRDVECDVEELRRAEAAARPTVSRLLPLHSEEDPQSLFAVYLETVLTELARRGTGLATDLRQLTDSLVPVLRAPGGTARLWSSVLPNVPEALDRFRAMGFGLVVVSNSDGTVADVLREQGLFDAFDAVVDSTLVGFEKPDPRIFQHALDVAGAEPQRTLHVGDLFEADVRGARGAGVHALLLDPYGDWADHDCERAADLDSLADRLQDARTE